MKRQRPISELTELLLAIPLGQRGTLVMEALSFRPSRHLEQSFRVGPLRAAFAKFWEAVEYSPIPLKELKRVLKAPVRIGTVLEFTKLDYIRDAREAECQLCRLVSYLQLRIWKFSHEHQRPLFEDDKLPPPSPPSQIGTTVSSLAALVTAGSKFPTIYADPPWPYENEASRAAAVNHYPVMSIDAIRAEPVGRVAAENSHLHLWTTNAFLREAFDVIDAWGFSFKSCLVWVKNDIGMGNYWRVSHEFLLLGVRGNLTFRDRRLASWILEDRSIHSRKPGRIRALVERVSPGPYLELFGREELPDSEWTVYGNQVEKRMC